MTIEPTEATERARNVVLEHFRWIDGDADVWSMLRDPEGLAAIVRGLGAPHRSSGVTAVAAIESCGFLLGGAVAISRSSSMKQPIPPESCCRQ
jgi:adenine phosphoribosyltransferase